MLLEGAKIILITSRYKYKLAYGALSWSVELCADDSTHFEDKIEENWAQKQQLFSFFRSFFMQVMQAWFPDCVMMITKFCAHMAYVVPCEAFYKLWCEKVCFYMSLKLTLIECGD